MYPACRKLLLIALLVLATARTAPGAGPPAGKEKPGAGKPAARTDRYGDPLPEGAVARLGTLRWRTGDCNWLAYAPDGKSVYVCSVTDDPGARHGNAPTDLIRQLDLKTGRELRRWHLPALPDDRQTPNAVDKRIAAVCLGRNWVAFYDARERLQLWDMARDRILWSLKDPGVYITLSPRGKFLARRERYRPYWIVVMDAATGHPRYRLDPHYANDHPVGYIGSRCLAFSPDEKFLAAKVDEGRVTVWDLTTGKEVFSRKTKLGFGGIRVLFAPDSKTLALQGDDIISLWDVARARELHRWSEGYGSLAFSPDGRTLATVWGAPHLWDVATGKERRRPSADHPDFTHATAFSPDG